MTYIIIGIIVWLIDIITKISAVKVLMPIRSVDIIKSILSFTYVENRGIAFGMFAGKRVLFIIISVIVLAAVVFVVVKTPKQSRGKFLKLGSALVISGAVGNLTDRIIKGFVVDFIEVKFMDFPVFNIADIAVCVGAAMLIIHFLFFDIKNVGSAEDKGDE